MIKASSCALYIPSIKKPVTKSKLYHDYNESERISPKRTRDEANKIRSFTFSQFETWSTPESDEASFFLKNVCHSIVSSFLRNSINNNVITSSTTVISTIDK